MTTFQDIFKSGFLEHISSVSLLDMAVSMLLAFLLGLFIFFVYKKSYTGVMYSAGFGLTLVAMTMITTLIIMAVVSNVVLSLGMVGALSIVRFRTAIKEPLDIAFLFWSIAAGIVLAAGMLPLAVFGSLVIGLVLLLFAGKGCPDSPYILVVRCENAEAEAAVRSLAEGAVRRLSLKSKSLSPGMIELHYEVRLQKGDTAFLDRIDALPGVAQAMLVSYNGDYMG